MLNVLFMQSQTYFGADSYIHSLIIKELDRSWINVHIACNYGDGQGKSASAQALEKLADIQMRPTKFGT